MTLTWQTTDPVQPTVRGAAQSDRICEARTPQVCAVRSPRPTSAGVLAHLACMEHWTCRISEGPSRLRLTHLQHQAALPKLGP